MHCTSWFAHFSIVCCNRVMTRSYMHFNFLGKGVKCTNTKLTTNIVLSVKINIKMSMQILKHKKYFFPS